MHEPLDRILADYVQGYDPDDAPGLTDLGIRASVRHVAERDPLRALARSADGRTSQVRLGVDPGTLFCGDQLADLGDLAAHEPFAGRTRVGFIHVPPDRDTGPAAAQAAHLHPRPTNLEHTAQVVAVALRAIARESGVHALLLTGFGPFQNVAHNPTAAFVGARAVIDRCVALAFSGMQRLGVDELLDPRGALAAVRHGYVGPSQRRLVIFAAELPLAATRDDALAGRYIYPSAAEANYRRIVAAICRELAGPPAALISLGVDSSQIAGGPPTFKVETQTRGWHAGSGRGRTATEHFRRTFDLPRIYLQARQDGDNILTYPGGSAASA